ncbi:hypothetical protein [Amycolatopsis sp. NPDC004169]|uniref:hypothetical protein n=1 Tax=Amycolatopsis sp. NPDC004169 TaxID=3154453 RepID=UPI0033BF140B
MSSRPRNSAWVGAGNRSGVHVGGFVGWDGKNHAARWDRAGRITALEQLPGAGGSSATDVDDTGLITGSADTASGGSRAAIWDERGRLDVLPDLGGRYNWAGTIARSGKILGIADRPEQASCDCHNTVYWNRSGRLTDLGLPFGAKSTYPDGGMNDSGVVAGSAYSEVPGVPHAIRWDPRDRPADLGTLPGGSWSRALGINACGVVIGEAGTSDHATHAVYWNPAGQPEDLGALPGATWSSPAAVNDHDVVVGFSQDPQTFTGRAVEWRRR